MTQVASTNSVRAKFEGIILTNETTRFILSRKDDEFWVRMEEIALAGQARTAATLDARIGLVTGSHHMQVFWVGDDEHNCQIGFPFTWLIPEQRWVPRNSTFVRPPGTEHRAETWNHVCARCHATGSEPNLDRAALAWRTRVGELGIACEACHGPGERHVNRERELEKLGQAVSRQATAEIVHPEKIDPIRASQICGFCHSMKWWDRTEGWPERGFSYRPGADLESSTPIIRPRSIDKQPWLSRVLENNPEIFRDFFWADGMIRVSGREYNGLIESPCAKSTQFSCLSCHSLHQSDPDDQLARSRKDNRACTQCHEALRDDSELSRHTRHLASSSGSECYNCHMPHTTYGVLKAIRSHEISSPKIDTQLATGRPNACNLCHLDKPLAWTARHLGNWFGHALPALSDEQSQIADSVRLALSGDAGQRALLAWHFGWKPAREISGEAWIPPVVAQLLDDSYAAVRCVAERSLKQMGASVPAGYDFAVQPVSREPVRHSMFEKWSRENSALQSGNLPPTTLVRSRDAAETQAAFDRLMRQRDDKPIRLRE